MKKTLTSHKSNYSVKVEYLAESINRFSTSRTRLTQAVKLLLNADK